MSIRLGACMLAFLAASCSEGPPPTSPSPSPSTPVADEAVPAPPKEEQAVSAKKEEWTLSFSDGSGNRYEIESSGHLVFDPVTPKESSSGTYSGGTPADLQLGEENISDVWRRVQVLAGDTAGHAKGRSMGTGSFRVTGAQGEQSFLVSMGPSLEEFTTFLGSLRPSE